METITLEQAQRARAELIHGLAPGEEVVITEDDRLIAPPAPPADAPPRRLGTMRGTVVSMAPDFDAPLDDFRDYRE